MSSQASRTSVYVAIAVNAVITAAKLATFAVTGSGSMLSEGVHSAADLGNQALLAVGMRKGERPPDLASPAGYGREAFVWSMMSAVGMFFLGCGVSVTHGITALVWEHAQRESHGWLNLGVLGLAVVLEGGSVVVALRGMYGDARANGMGFLEYFRRTDDPFGVAVLFEDVAAILGVAVAIAAVGLTEITGHAYWDAIGSIGIGVLLGAVAVFLIQKNRTLLIGRSIRAEDREKLHRVLVSDPAVEAVRYHVGWVVGTSAYRIHTEVDFDGRYFARKYFEHADPEEIRAKLKTAEDVKLWVAEYSEDLVTRMGEEIDRIEVRIREEIPKAQHIAIEPD